MHKIHDLTHDITKIMFPLCKRKILKQTIVSSAFILLFIQLCFFYILKYDTTSNNQITLLTMLIFYLLIIIIPLLNYLYFRNYFNLYFYDFKKDHVHIKDAFLEKEKIISYSQIEDVYIDQDFLDKFLDLYDIHFSLGRKNNIFRKDPHIDGIEKEIADKMMSFVLNSMSYSLRQKSNIQT